MLDSEQSTIKLSKPNHDMKRVEYDLNEGIIGKGQFRRHSTVDNIIDKYKEL